MMVSMDVAECEDGVSTEHDSTEEECSGRVAENQVVLSEDQSSVKYAKSVHTLVIEGGSSAVMEQNSAAAVDMRGVPADETFNMGSTKSKWQECPAMAFTLKRILWHSDLHSLWKSVIMLMYVFPFIKIVSLDVAGCEEGESTGHDSTAAEYLGRVVERQVVSSKAQSNVRDAKSDPMLVIEEGSSAAMEQNCSDDADLRGVPGDETSNMESTKSKWPECLTVSITLKLETWNLKIVY